MNQVRHKIEKHKLALSFILIILLFISCGVITIKGLVTLGNLTRTIYDHPLVVSNASLRAALHITKMHRSMKDVVLAGTFEEAGQALMRVSESEQEVFHELDVIRKNILGKEGQQLEAQTRKIFIEWKPIRDEVVHLYRSGNRKGAVLITKQKGADHVTKLEAKMLELTSYARKKADGFIQFAEKSQSNLEKITVILTISGILISVTIAIITTYFVIKTETALQDEKNKLQHALDEINTLSGLIPICSNCKKIRDDKGYWSQLEKYIESHSEAMFSHGICPDCSEELYGNKPWYNKMNNGPKPAE